MTPKTGQTSLAERVWDDVEARLSGGQLPPIRVLFATDGSEPAHAAEAFLALAPLPPGSSVEVVAVLDAETWEGQEGLIGAEREWALRITQGSSARLGREGVQFSHASPRGLPAYEILRLADEFRADLVVVGSHGRTGLQKFLLGSVAENVARHARCPVLVARAPAHGLRRVILAVDGSEHADHALRLAAHFPLPAAAEVTVCHVVRPYQPLMGPEYVPDMLKLVEDVREQQREEAERLVDAARDRLAKWGKQASTVVREGDPAAEILALAAAQEADLVVAGARGISPIEALLVGSVADRLLKHARCSVLLAR